MPTLTSNAPSASERNRDTLDELSVLRAEHAALRASQAVIEFELDGTIVDANENFLRVLGYRLDEIRGRHHSMFVEPGFEKSADYRRFWEELAAGRYQAAEYKRIGKGGKEVWIQGSYNPLLDASGRAFKVVKFATDVTERRLRNADYEGQLAAIRKSQAVIEFQLDGTVLDANENFLNVLGYRLDEIRGRHHSMFVEPGFEKSAEYRRFWDELAAGRYQAAEYKRIGKGGKEVWIQASYNPILDASGRPVKVVKFATDVTEQVRSRQHLRALVEKVRATSGTLGGASEELTTVTTHIQGNSTETSTQAQSVAAAAEQVSRSSQTVASGIAEMTASISEISRTTSDAASVAQQAVQLSKDTNEKIRKLGESSVEIGKVVKVIAGIAQQTNLLALNATIEAARAGESGKGFAVVATEVKELARQSAQASENIAGRIEAVQSDTSAAVKAILEIGKIIERINDAQTSIAGAIEEQTATTSEISKNVSEVAGASDAIARSITAVATAAQNTASGVSQARSAVAELTQVAVELTRLVANS